ncbi:MAG: HEAT repeat domain-containing protein [Planctomycetota bacterium]
MSTPPLVAAETSGFAAPRRTQFLLPVLAVLVLLGLVFILPQRDADTIAPMAVASGLAAPDPLTVDEPPAWCLQRGVDPVTRALDRLNWAGHGSLPYTREWLALHCGRLATDLLSRLRTLGEESPVVVARLIEVLAQEDPQAPGLIDELLRRALSTNALTSRAAIRALAAIDHPRAIEGLLPQLASSDPETVAFGIAGLCERARRGDAEAQSALLDLLESESEQPEPSALSALDAFPESARLTALLKQFSAHGDPTVRLLALAARLRRDDPEAVAHFEHLLAHRDPIPRINGLNTVAGARKVLGEESWDALANLGMPTEQVPLLAILTEAVDQGSAAAPHALTLIEQFGTTPGHPVRMQALQTLLQREHPWAVETTRQELQSAVGSALGEAVGRVLVTRAPLRQELVLLAKARLAEPELRDEDRWQLCRLLAAAAPELGADPIVRVVLGRDEAPPWLVESMASLLGQLGPAGLQRLAQELDDPLGRALYVRIAGGLRAPEALEPLRRILLDPRTERSVLFEGLDALVKLPQGPREEVLREVLKQRDDPVLSERGRLLFWNYL